MSFTGFGKQALPFFKALAFHQTKDWFEANRSIYENDVKEPFGDLIEDLSTELPKAGLPLHGDRKKALFRIHRDVRFAKDKSPYKTNAGAVLNRDGTKGTGGMLYIHLDPEGCFAAAGWWHPEKETIEAVRADIVKSPKPFFAMEDALAKAKLKFSEGHELKRTPKGYEKITDDRALAAIRRTGYVVSRPLKDSELHSSKLVKSITAFAKDAEPLLRYGWKVAG